MSVYICVCNKKYFFITANEKVSLAISHSPVQLLHGSNNFYTQCNLENNNKKPAFIFSETLSL